MESSFDRWNRRKQFADLEGAPRYPKEGEIWWCVLGRNIGSEENGKGPEFMGPVLVVRRFNNRLVWCVPLVRGQKEADFFVNFTDRWGRPAAVVLAQLRVLSPRRFERKIGRIDPLVFRDVRKRTAETLSY